MAFMEMLLFLYLKCSCFIHTMDLLGLFGMYCFKYYFSHGLKVSEESHDSGLDNKRPVNRCCLQVVRAEVNLGKGS